MTVDWRRHRRTVEVHGVAANVVDIGHGPALLLIHGLGGTWQNWLENIPALSRHHRVIAPDLPGFGESPLPAEALTIGYFADWLAALMRTLSIERVALVGNSMGGQIAAELALRKPQLVNRLVLVGAAGISSEGLRNGRVLMVLQRADRIVSLWSRHVVSAGRRLAGRRRARRVLLKLWVHDPDRISGQLLAELGKGAGKPGFAAALRGVTTHVMRARLSEISCPTLIVWGEGDRIIPVRDAHTFHRSIRDAELVVLPATGHLAMIERAAEFNRDVAAFLGAMDPAAG